MKITALLSDEVILEEIGRRLHRHRLDRLLTQAKLAEEAGVSKRTVERLEAGNSTQFSSFLRVCRSLGLLDGMGELVPLPEPSPLELLSLQGKQRQRAPSDASLKSEVAEPADWTWGDDT